MLGVIWCFLMCWSSWTKPVIRLTRRAYTDALSLWAEKQNTFIASDGEAIVSGDPQRHLDGDLSRGRKWHLASNHRHLPFNVSVVPATHCFRGRIYDVLAS